jgi:hypothetical protein
MFGQVPVNYAKTKKFQRSISYQKASGGNRGFFK